MTLIIVGLKLGSSNIKLMMVPKIMPLISVLNSAGFLSKARFMIKEPNNNPIKKNIPNIIKGITFEKATILLVIRSTIIVLIKSRRGKYTPKITSNKAPLIPGIIKASDETKPDIIKIR